MTTKKLETSLELMRQTLDKREAAKMHQLALWPDKDMGVPNELSRSALFAAIDDKYPRKTFDNAVIPSQAGFDITYTGHQLDQGHIDIFEGIMHFARGVHEGNLVRFSRHRLLKLIGRSTGGNEHKWLLSRLNHLTATSVCINQGDKRVFWGSLLPRGATDNETGEYIVEISRDLAKLFGRGFTRVEWEQRYQLKRSPLAQWLQLYYSSHAQPMPVSVSWLHEVTGSGTQELRKFRQSLRAALRKLEAIAAITGWSIDPKSDLVHVIRTPSQAQARYLANRDEKTRV